MNTMKSPNSDLIGFTKDEASGVFKRFAGEEIRKKLTQRIKGIIEADLRDFFFTEAPVINMDSLTRVGMPHVMLRIVTLHAILDGFRTALGEKYNDILRSIGGNVGFSFAVDLMDYLRRKSGHIPLNYEALLSFWSIFDSSADMGEIKIEEKEIENPTSLIVGIWHGFLTEGYEKEQHRHCPFMEGYIRNALDTLIGQWTRWIEKTHYRPPRKKLCVARVKENPSKTHCMFEVHLDEEKFSAMKDTLMVSIREFQNKDFKAANKSARNALDCALKVPLGLEDDFPVSFSRLLKTYEKTGVPLCYNRWLSVYDTLSPYHHGDKEADFYETLQNLFSVKRLLDEWLEIDLPDDQKKTLINKKSEYGIFRKK